MLVKRLDLNKFILVLEIKQEGIRNKVKIDRPAQIQLELLDRLKYLRQVIVVECL